MEIKSTSNVNSHNVEKKSLGYIIFLVNFSPQNLMIILRLFITYIKVEFYCNDIMAK